MKELMLKESNRLLEIKYKLSKSMIEMDILLD